MDWEAQDDGFLAKIIVEEGAKDVSVGTPVAVVVEEQDDVSLPSLLICPQGVAACKEQHCFRGSHMQWR